MSESYLRRVKLAFERNFTQMPNDWHRDNKLSLTARGLLGLLMSHDEGWEVSYKSLAATNPEGRTAIEAAVRELKAANYLAISPRRARGGRVDGWTWELTDPAQVAQDAAANQLAGFPSYGSTVTRVSRNTVNQHLKEQNPKEHLTQELKTRDSTRAGVNEDASGDSSLDAALTPEDLYQRSLHAPCTFLKRRECEWAPSGYCAHCGRERPSLLDSPEFARPVTHA